MGMNPRGAAWPAEVLPAVTRALVLAATTEFLLLRVVSRMSGSLSSPAGRAVAGDLVLLGTVAYNAALLLSLAVLVLAARALVPLSPRTSAVLALASAGVIAALLVGPMVPVAVLVGDAAAVAALVWLMATHLRDIAPRRARAAMREAIPRILFPSLVVGTFLAAFYLHTGDLLATFGLGPPARTDVYRLGEALAVSAALTAPWVVPLARTRAALSVGLAVGAAALAVLFLRPEIAALAAFWSVGFRLDLPAVVYAAAAGSYGATLFGAARMRGTLPYLLAGLALVALAGRMLIDFYFVALALAGFTFLTIGGRLPAPAPGRPRQRPAEQPGPA